MERLDQAWSELLLAYFLAKHDWLCAILGEAKTTKKVPV